SLSEVVAKQTSRALSDGVILSEQITSSRPLNVILTESLSLSDSLLRGRILTDSLSLSEVVAKQTSRALSDGVSLSEQITRGRILIDGLSLSDLLTKRLITPAVIPYITPDGRVIEVKFYTLDHLMFGFILGVSKLGFGALLPKESTFYQPEGKKNPEFIEVIKNKVKGIINRQTLSTWSYALYNKPEEMVDYHKSERTEQYDLLQTQRRFIEDWVLSRLPKTVTSKVLVRQYQNAVLQAVGWKTKRHFWGFEPFKDTPEDKFKDWWLANWKAYGLDENILLDLYNNLETIIKAIRDVKTQIGEKVKKTRRILSGSTYP
ncbi:MAG: hypothetical protein ACPLZG_09390, partial [Thermoproteota archaeon]